VLRRSAAILLFAFAGGCGDDDEGGGGGGPPRLDVMFSARAARFAHAEGTSGQTMQGAALGVRSLTLIAESGEAWTLFDRGGHPAAAVRLDAGTRTLAGVLFPERVLIGRYRRARIVQDWIRFEIDATLHDPDALPGALRALLVTSEGTEIDGEPLPAGHALFEHTHDEVTVRFSRQDAGLAGYATSAGLSAGPEQGDWVIELPLELDLDSGNGVLSFELNVHEAFRWRDEPAEGQRPGAYDLSRESAEPIVQVGPNAIGVSFDRR
jgi:hypothetical protein